MRFFPCFQCQRRKKDSKVLLHGGKKQRPGCNHNQKSHGNAHQVDIKAQNFTFRELAAATKNFRQEFLLGQGGLGRVYRGTLPKSGQVVAVKQLDRHGLQGNNEFLQEVSTLSLLHHDNLVKLIGYCADGDQRLLVYDYLPGGTTESHLLGTVSGPHAFPLSLSAHTPFLSSKEVFQGEFMRLFCLHDKANPPIIHRDLKCSNVLLDENFNPRLSDFGLAKLGHAGDKIHVSSRVMGTYGYCAPEYTETGKLTAKSDVYSFGVVLLELITGRRAIDTTKPNAEQNLVSWAQPKFRSPKLFPEIVDPLLHEQFPEKALNQVVAVAAMCLQEEASVRPLMSDVVTALGFLVEIPEDFPAHKKARNSEANSEHGYSLDVRENSYSSVHE